MKQRRTLLGLLVCWLVSGVLLLLSFHANRANAQLSKKGEHGPPLPFSSTVRIPSTFSRSVGPWFCTPDPDTELPASLFSTGEFQKGKHNSTADAEQVSDNARLLSRLGVPFIIDTYNQDDLLCLRQLLGFRDAATGTSPPIYLAEGWYSEALRPYYFAFHPEELVARYGAERLAGFALTEASWHWDAVEPGSLYVGDTLHEADLYVASRPEPPRTPGVVVVRTRDSWGGPVSTIELSLSNIRYDLNSTVMQLILDADTDGRRVYRQSRVRAKLSYAKYIDELDDAIRREAQAVIDAIGEEIGKAQRNYISERRRRASYEQFVKERQERLRREESGDGSSHPAVGRRVTPLMLTREGHRAALERKKHATCYKLNKALATLQSQGANDSRRAKVIGLLDKHACQQQQQVSPNARLLPLVGSVCDAYCDALTDLMEWQQYTGQTPTVAQCFAHLFTLYANVTLGDSSEAGDEAFDAEGKLQMNSFSAWVHTHFVRQHFEACTCVTPPEVKGEFYFTMGLVNLLLSQRNTSTRTAVARGVLALHQAYWLGSTQAAAALSTLREQGIYLKQNVKAAQVLLTNSMRESSGRMYGELWNDLLMKRGPSDGTVEQVHGHDSSRLKCKITAARHAERVLRNERMYGTPYSWSDVDNTFATKELIQQFFVVDDQYFESVDEESGETVRKELPESVLEEEDSHEADGGGDKGGSGGDAGAGSGQGPFGARMQSHLTKANFFAHGFRIKRNVHAAECQLLSVLRKFDYLCDMHVLMDIAIKRTGETDRRSPAAQAAAKGVIAEAKGVCEAHAEDLSAVFARPRRNRFPCPWPATTEGAARRGPPFPIVEENFNTLHSTLTMLGYLYLAKGNDASAAVYARLATELAATAFRYASQVHLWTPSGIPPAVPLAVKQYHQHGMAGFKKVMKWQPSPWKRWWMRKLIVSLVEFDEELLYMLLPQHKTVLPSNRPPGLTAAAAARTSTWLEQNESFPMALVDSTFPVGENLVALAMTVLLDTSTLGPDDSETVAMWSARDVLRGAFGGRGVNLVATLSQYSIFTPCNNTAIATLAVSLPQSTPQGRLHQQQHLALFLLLAAASQWRTVYKTGHTFEHTFYSDHTADPFIHLTWLLKDLAATAPEGQCVSVHAIRRLGSELEPLVGARPFLPLPHDTVDSYARRLLRHAIHSIYSADAFVTAFHQGMARVEGGGRGDVNGDMLRRSRLSFLRTRKQLSLDRAHFLPLLYASDTQAYLTRTKTWTMVERVGDALINGLYYLFTETTRETLEREMGLEILPPIPGGRAQVLKPSSGSGGQGNKPGLAPFWVTHRQESPALFVRDFVELFDTFPEVREMSVAVQLLSVALESGLPEGFSLILLEASPDRSNAYLDSFAEYLASSVFGPLTESMWKEEHVTAQWHRDKPDLRRYSSALTLNGHTPFRYAPPEARQELMARVDLWRARRLLEQAKHDDANPAQSPTALPQRKQLLLRAAEILSRCTGAVTHAAVRRWLYEYQAHVRSGNTTHHVAPKVQIPSSPFEGMLFPAADPACGEELLKLLQSLAAEGLLHFTSSDAAVYLDRVMGQLLTRLALYYQLTDEDPPRRTLPSTQSEFAEAPAVDAAGGNSDEESEDQDEGKDRAGSSRGGPHDRGDLDYVPIDRRTVHYMVEPWAVVRKDANEEPRAQPANGEGAFYFNRLHRVSGFRSGARIQSTWYWLKGLFSS